MISYHETPANRAAKASRADEILRTHEAADRAAQNVFIRETGKMPADHETPDQFLHRIGYK